MDRYCVVGDPVAHSLSPRIHGRFAEQLGENMEYGAVRVAPGSLAGMVAAFRAEGGRGMNVTLPLKEEALEVADRLSARAAAAGAVNTLSFDAEGAIAGDNTDGIGLVRDLLANLDLSLRDCTILIIGAGGAARGIVGPLLDAGPRELAVANRNAERARRLAADLADCGPIALRPLEGALTEPPDLLINATSAGHGGGAFPVPPALLVGTVCYDLSYGAAAETFLAWARACGATRCHDGLGMLVEQAAESFRIWRGRRPDTAPVLRELRSA